MSAFADVVIHSSDLVFAEVDGEAVAMSAAKGVCYGLDAIGLRVLQLIDGEASVGEICARLETEYEVDQETCVRDVSDLLANLVAEGLVTLELAS
jgi:hypothetical protein